ncbi:hypothetical protein [Paenibacillus dendritiformis]|nr:hypothetical protein [Paenibacillus dendritiformis]
MGYKQLFVQDEGLILDTADIITYAGQSQVQADIKEGMRKQ